MRILLRNYDDKPYVWKDAEYKDEQYFLDGKRIYETEIAAVDGIKTDHVVCKTCGEVILNTPEAIEAHYAKRERERDCASCERLQFSRNEPMPKRKLVDIGNGTFQVTEEFTSKLFCKDGWRTREMTDQYTLQRCSYMQCRANGVRQFNDIFHKYPGVFDTTVTVDALLAKKFKYNGTQGSYFVYDMRSRGTIKALVNKLGIVECFQVSSNGAKVRYYYSEKYDKLFYASNVIYIEGYPCWFREAKFDEAHDKIKALYEGAK